MEYGLLIPLFLLTSLNIYFLGTLYNLGSNLVTFYTIIAIFVKLKFAFTVF